MLTPAELYLRLEAVAGADAVREPELVLVSPWRRSLSDPQSAQSMPTPQACLLGARIGAAERSDYAGVELNLLMSLHSV